MTDIQVTYREQVPVQVSTTLVHPTTVTQYSTFKTLVVPDRETCETLADDYKDGIGAVFQFSQVILDLMESGF